MKKERHKFVSNYYEDRFSKWPKEFREWQYRFYNSKEWKELRQQVRDAKRMRCDMCGKLIRGRSITDHIIEITPYNREDVSITLNADNLRLLCIECHNQRTFGKQVDFELKERSDVNLF
jgi:5-methylcytosine-specific restriction endonuclease McrA